MNYKEDENELLLNLNIKIILNIVIHFAVVGFMGYRIYLASNPVVSQTPSRVVVPRLKISNLEDLSVSLKATTSGDLNSQVQGIEPFN